MNKRRVRIYIQIQNRIIFSSTTNNAFVLAGKDKTLPQPVQIVSCFLTKKSSFEDSVGWPELGLASREEW